MAPGYESGDWLAWCQANKSWLSGEFLRTVDAGASVRPFFGSWFDIQGRKQCGYYVGHEAIRQLEADMSLDEIALLDDVKSRLRGALNVLADDQEE
jgi:hypothetical protein